MDNIWPESGVYGPATTRSMLACTHLKRSFHAQEDTICALYQLVMQEFYKEHPEEEQELRSIIDEHPTNKDRMEHLINFHPYLSNYLPFIAIGVDHAVEQENKLLKIDGGLRGIANNEKARNCFFVAAPIINRLCSELQERHTVPKQHHNLIPFQISKQAEWVKRIKDTIEEHMNSFSSDDCGIFRNMVTNAVVEERFVQDSVKVTAKGKASLEVFENERLVKGTKNTPAKNVKLERNLFAKFLILSTSSRQIDEKQITGNYELCDYPQSLMISNELIPCNDKYKLASALLELCESDEEVHHRSDVPRDAEIPSTERYLILHGMAVVQSLAKKATRLRRNQTCTSWYYGVEGSTNISDISFKEFLSNEATKRELTKYLAAKFLPPFSRRNIKLYTVEKNKLRRRCSCVMLVLCSRSLLQNKNENGNKDLSHRQNACSSWGRSITGIIGTSHDFWCDPVGHFTGKGKFTWFRGLQRVEDESSIAALQNFYIKLVLDERDAENIARFVSFVYMDKSMSLPNARAYLFTKKIAEGEKPLPTT
eukprot:gene17161-18883_t